MSNKRKRGWHASLDPLSEDEEDRPAYTLNTADGSLISNLLCLIPRWFQSKPEEPSVAEEEFDLDEHTAAIIDPPESEMMMSPAGPEAASCLPNTVGRIDLDPTQPDSENLEGPETAPYGAFAQLRPFIEVLPRFQEIILDREHQEGIGSPCSCDQKEAMYRCHDCFETPAFCADCIKSCHRNLPFHRLQKWSETHFANHPLEDVGFELYLGHYGFPCPNLRTGSSYKARRFVIVHTNGFHHLPIHFCHCRGFDIASEPYQLLKAKLFSSTLGRPETVFTFQLLDDFHVHNLASKKSMFDYHQALQEMTNPSSTEKVPNRYRELLRIDRIWRHLASLRRSGQAHGIDNHLPHRRPDSLAVRCPACPEPGFNIDPAIFQNPEKLEDQKHKYMYFISVDGNFRLQQNFKSEKNSDPNDIPLNAGNAYFVPDAPYQTYLKGIQLDDTRSTCAHLNAARLQNVAKFKNARVSGVVSVQCARHAFFLPQGTVDLEKGEAYARTDFALAFALREAGRLRWIRCSYDLWCHFVINLLKRIMACFSGALPIFKNISGSIPKMHVKNHVDSCQNRWSFNFLPHSGETCGESIETTWAEQNQLSAATREMNSGHRHDALDDSFGYWNWRKKKSLATLLSTRYLDCVKRREGYEKDFNELTSRYEKNIPDALKKWREMDIAPKLVDNEWVSVYQARFQGVKPPTQRKVYEDLLRADMGKEVAREDEPAGKFWVVFEGIEIELEQHRLRKLFSKSLQRESQDGTANNELLTSRVLLIRRIRKWRPFQKFHCPTLASRLDIAEDVSPEDVPLYLPSSLSQQDRKKLKLDNLVEAELKLRTGQCHDALDRVRLAIKVFNYNCKFTQVEVIGQGPNTRAQAFLRSLKEDQYGDAEIYRLSREAYMRLRYAPDDEDAIVRDAFKPLLDAELWGKDTTRQPQLGDTRREEPWFWTIDCPPGVDQGEWSLELDRVQWFRYQALLQRCTEEIEILEEEIKRVRCSFSTLSRVWATIGSKEKRPGSSSYAHKQAAMYNDFEEKALKVMKGAFKMEI